MRCRGAIPEVAVAANPHLTAAFADRGGPLAVCGSRVIAETS